MKTKFCKNCSKIISDRIKRYQKKYGNPFKGKRHTQATKDKIGKSSKGRCLGEKNYKYKGRYINNHGYVMICDAKKGGAVKEHRKIMEEVLGRKLKSWEVVHHKDGNRINNKLENLQLTTVNNHPKLHKKVRNKT